MKLTKEQKNLIKEIKVQEGDWGRGECYKRAYSKAEEVKGKIVHGTVCPPGVGKNIKHAWVEKGDLVCDDSTLPPFKTSKKWYYAEVNAKVDNIYSTSEAWVLKMRTRSFGPWTKKEIKHALKLLKTDQKLSEYLAKRNS